MELSGPESDSGYRPGASLSWFVCLSIVAVFPFHLAAAEPDLVTQQYIARALQGDISHASQLFETMTPQTSSDLDHYLAEQFQHRFVLHNENFPPISGKPLIDELIATYRQYWTEFLTAEKPGDEGFESLQRALNNLLVKYGKSDSTSSAADVFTKIKLALAAEGLYSNLNFASPLYDLMIWKTQHSVSFLIELTDQSITADVIFMDDFDSIGWSDFATLGMASSGGWTADDKLYCVSWAWNQASENFRVSYLKHEGRHLADNERFPHLEAAELEYRAKLTELAFASSTLPRLLNKFTRNASYNPTSPHAFANNRVVRDLYLKIFGTYLPEDGDPWQWVRADRVNPAARALLDENTHNLIENNGF